MSRTGGSSGATSIEERPPTFSRLRRISPEKFQKNCASRSHRKKELLARRYTEDVEVYHLYLKGKFFWGNRTEDGLKKGIQYFRQGTARGHRTGSQVSARAA